ncbi:patatin-like phospholipase family protein [Entomospira entomophila]|uniref:PNPLA domain-containing protein n=1 Tax=Entomospira entomophila TaxID=2719988 RepID=A0A968GAS9_9SPIO|nr:patatin-like phospholipase family protein [Entomospira entomophilus]NIZ40945.1 hypothetical protein [Entomospira entomophilus]WDI35158.1 patatin-like phospholipase family protein [Entomospira entomophilus]
MKKRTFRKLGLALAGGGGRGAYQVGILRALLETDFYDKIHMMAGTSVGALNEILYVHRDFHLANYIWRCTIDQAILYLDKDRFRSEWGILKHGVYAGESEKRSPFDGLKGMFAKSGFKAGIFSREGLVRILQDEINLAMVQKSPIPLFATATHAATKRIDYFRLDNLRDQQEIIDILLASSALPGIFGRQYLNGEEYYDGGIHNNVPIDVLYEAGCDLILVLHLFRTRDKITHSSYPNAKIIELIPEQSLGGIMGTLDFSTKTVRSTISRGYQENIDVLTALQHHFDIKRRPKLFAWRQ